MAIINDVSNMLHRVIHMNREAVIENPMMVTHLVSAMLLSVADKFGVSNDNPIVLAVDARNNWRKEYYETNKTSFPEYSDMSYKGHRVKDSAFDWQSIYKYTNQLMAALDSYSDFQVLEVECAEADDIIAVYAREMSKTQKVIIITSDKDMKQCQCDNVEIYDPIKKIFIPVIDIERFKKLHIMIGDKSDNILAIKPRLGEKTAEKLYPELDLLLATNPEMRSRYEFNQNLIDFDYINDKVVSNIERAIQKPYHNFHSMSLMKEFQLLNMVQMTEKISRFKLTNKQVSAKIISNETIRKITEVHHQTILDNFFNE